MKHTKKFFTEMLLRYTSMCKNTFKKIFFCVLYVFLLLLLCITHVILLDQDRFRHLLSDIFVSILNCLNVFDMTILYIISEPRVRKKALSGDRKMAIALIC